MDPFDVALSDAGPRAGLRRVAKTRLPWRGSKGLDPECDDICSAESLRKETKICLLNRITPCPTNSVEKLHIDSLNVGEYDCIPV